MKLITFIFAMTLTFYVSAQVNIIPLPVSIKQPKIAANFSLTPATQIVPEGSNMDNSINFFNDYLQQYYRFKLKVVKNSTSKNVIRLNYERMDNKAADAYNLTVNGNGIYIAGDNENGVFYGIQTLIQLLPLPGVSTQVRPNKLNIAYISIQDAPRFAYRGMHLDAGRHFMPVDFVKKYIDYLALHKFNTFHWHLTEDQGWRIEIKKYPNLTKTGGRRNGTIIGRYPGTGNDNKPDSGFYTQEQIKDIVKYATNRYITIIPEIELPGHSSAAIAAYPQLSCFPDEKTKIPDNMISEASKKANGKLVQETWGVFEDVFCPSEYTFNFLQDVLDEVMVLFPSQYIHIGGDECPKEAWKRSAFCQQLIKEKGLKDEHGLQSYFIQRIEKYVNSKGRKIIGWDEILEGGLAPNATVMSWRGEEGGIDAARQNHDVIMTPGTPVYFDHSQSLNEDSVTIGGYNSLEMVYAYEPVPKELNQEQAKHVLGAQANVWTEYMAYPSKVEYMIFPRISTLSEVLWSPKEKRNWSDFQKRLMTQFKRYDLWSVNYSKAYFDLKATVLPTENHDGVLWKVENKLDKPITINFNRGDSIWAYEKPQLIQKDIDAYASININNKNVSVGQLFHFNKATGQKITLTREASKNYPGDGAFTLVNGIQNEKGLARSTEFLGFNGTDCDALINLGSFQTITSVTVHVFQQQGSWIWRPLSMEAFTSDDGQYFGSLGKTDTFNITKGGNGTMTVKGTNTGRYVKVLVKNRGTIPDGNPGAGNKAWLFIDEIEVQ